MADSSVRVERSSAGIGNPLPSIISVALLTAALGGVLAYHADWAGAHVIAGLAAYAAVSCIIASAIGLERGRTSFGLANQVTLLRAGLVCLIGGARFDLEIDALLIVILAVLAWQTGRVGPWVLAIGLLRYAFVLGGWLLPWLRRPLPPSRRRQAVCVQQGISLLLCLLPPVGTTLASLCAGSALLALSASFASDLIHLARVSGAHGADRCG